MSTGYPHRLGRGGVNQLADVVGAGRAYQLEVWLINAEHLHNVPGHKTVALGVDRADDHTAWFAPASCPRRRFVSRGT